MCAVIGSFSFGVVHLVCGTGTQGVGTFGFFLSSFVSKELSVYESASLYLYQSNHSGLDLVL